MAEVLGTMAQTSELDLINAKGQVGVGKLVVRMDEVEHQHDLVTLKLSAKQVRDWCNNSFIVFLGVVLVLRYSVSLRCDRQGKPYQTPGLDSICAASASFLPGRTAPLKNNWNCFAFDIDEQDMPAATL